MNGRLYDPKLHRFLAPDNYVQDPYNTQNFNRYGYVFNNPLMYTDPSGEVAWFVPILIGAAVSAASYTITALTADVPFTVGGLVKATVIGAASGAMTFGIGEATSAITQLGVRISVQAVAHGMIQGVMSGIQGGNFWQGAASGALASIGASAWGNLGGNFAQSGAGQITFGTVSGGAGAALTGGNFWEGAAMGFVVSALNHVAHRIEQSTQRAKYFKDKGEAYDYMWENSFKDGKPYKELSGWELEDGGTIVLPHDKNTVNKSYNNALKVVRRKDGLYVKYKGSYRKINTHVHTHPTITPNNPIGLSTSDLSLIRIIGKPIHILYDSKLYSVNGSYNYKLNRYNFKDLGKW